MYKVEVNAEKCDGCGKCVDVCPVLAFEIQEGKSILVNAEECLGCECCIAFCKEWAITVEEICLVDQ